MATVEVTGTRVLRFGVAGLGVASQEIVPNIVAHLHPGVVVAAEPTREAMNAAAERTGVKLLCGHTHSFDPPIRKMR